MPIRVRTLLFAIGILIAVATISGLYRKAVRIASAEKAAKLRTPVSDIKAGSYRFIADLYGKAPNRDLRSLLFVRKNDGALRVWYFPLRDKHPAAPADDWLTPGPVCDEFHIDTEREEIECVVNNAETRQQIHLRWSWDGKGFGPLSMDMTAVPGKEEGGAFVFDVDSTILAKDRK